MSNFLNEFQNNSPKAYKYFLEYYDNDFENKIGEIDFNSLAFEFQLGVFLSFFSSMSIDVQLYSIEKEALIDSIKEAFATYEEYLFLDS